MKIMLKKNRTKAILVSICAIVVLLAGATCALAAKFHVTSIDIPAQHTFELGATSTIEVAYSVESAFPESISIAAAKALPLSWASSDASVAEVDNHGKITAVGPGTAEISVSGQDGALNDSCAVTVTVTPETISVPESVSLTLNYADTQNLGAALLPENTTAKVCYTSSNEAVATVNANGDVTAVGGGECIIRSWAVDTLTGATYELSNETKVSVTVAPAELSLSNISLRVGASTHVTPTITPEEVDVGTNFTWKSSDEAIATVDNTGLVTAHKIGSTTLSVSNELGQSASCTVSVIGCNYCGASDHTTTYCANKAVEQRGALGRWRIPSVGVDVACFSGNSQRICDNIDSANYYHMGNTLVIADHNNQGFNAIKSCQVGAVAYFDTGDGVQKFICTKKEIGTNKEEVMSNGGIGCILRYSDGEKVQYAGRGGLICFTCNESYRSVTIVTFQPAS